MKHRRFSLFYVCFVLACVLDAVLGGRTFNFQLPKFPIWKSEKSESLIKIYDGRRVQNDSIIMVYTNELTVAVVELGPEKLLLDCYVIEIFSDEDIERAMGPLRGKTTPVPITMEEMLHLMNQCAELDQLTPQDYAKVSDPHEEETKNLSQRLEEIKSVFTHKPTVLSGIVPGTKWCGTGDLAENYHELGEDSLTDTCCRNHDLCPVKIRAFTKKYGLSNNSLYTKSHCRCDDIFNSCLKARGTQAADVLGQIYFNFVKVQCVEDAKEGKYFRPSKGY